MFKWLKGCGFVAVLPHPHPMLLIQMFPLMYVASMTDIPVHHGRILYHVDDTAVFAHHQSPPRALIGKHPVSLQLGHHLVDHRAGCKRLAAGYAAEWRLLMKGFRLFAFSWIELQARDQG